AAFILGIINLRGNVVTIIDTRDRFGMPHGDVSDSSRIVIIEAVGQVVGMLVDSVADVVYLRQSEIDKTPNVGNEDKAKFIQGVCNKNGVLLISIQLEAMIEAGLEEYKL
ncbi:MAG: chemotaxis protein CheW, partial [Pseudomonadales bacterium]|nr:chemotaxis protein CheW [Pseudomonadales bacterium]